MSEAASPKRTLAVTWAATAVLVGAVVGGAVLVERKLSRTWARMREDIHPFAPAAASLKRRRAAYQKQLEHAFDAGEVIGELIRLVPRSR
jgi:hypothetical protein